MLVLSILKFSIVIVKVLSVLQTLYLYVFTYTFMSAIKHKTLDKFSVIAKANLIRFVCCPLNLRQEICQRLQNKSKFLYLCNQIVVQRRWPTMNLEVHILHFEIPEWFSQ